MTQFRPRFPQSPLSSPARVADAKLRMQGDPYATENTDSHYAGRLIENQKIKNLSFWDNTDPQGNEEPEWAERQSPMPFILAIIALVVASTVLWFLFRWASGENTNTPPIIAADTAPFKVRPENPGGMMIPHQDKLIYGRLRQDTPQPIERLLPPPEQPMVAPPPHMAESQMGPPPTNNPQMGTPPLMPQMMSNPSMEVQPHQSQSYPQGQQGYAPNTTMQPVPQPQFQPPNPQYYPAPQGQVPYPQPQPYQGPNSYQAPVQQQAPYGPALPAPAMNNQQQTPQIPLQTASNPVPLKQLSPVENIKPASEEEETENLVSSEGQSELDKLIAKEAAIPLKRAPQKNDKKPLKTMPINSGKHKVQIASLPSRSMAEQEMKRLRTQHSSIFQNKPWDIQRINLGAARGSTHRLVVGSFSNHAAALKFCKKLRGEKIGCLVVAPASE